MIFSNLVSAEFKLEVEAIASRLKLNPNHLMAVMWSESRLDPQARNSIGGATGLIQFMPSTATALGTTSDALQKMNGVEQLVYVERFFRPYASRCKSFGDLYLACFFPIAIGKADDYVLQTSKLSAGLIARQNPLFDTDKDGKITVGEFRSKLKTLYPEAVRAMLF